MWGRKRGRKKTCVRELIRMNRQPGFLLPWKRDSAFLSCGLFAACVYLLLIETGGYYCARSVQTEAWWNWFMIAEREEGREEVTLNCWWLNIIFSLLDIQGALAVRQWLHNWTVHTGVSSDSSLIFGFFLHELRIYLKVSLENMLSHLDLREVFLILHPVLSSFSFFLGGEQKGKRPFGLLYKTQLCNVIHSFPSNVLQLLCLNPGWSGVSWLTETLRSSKPWQEKNTNVLGVFSVFLCVHAKLGPSSCLANPLIA